LLRPAQSAFQEYALAREQPRPNSAGASPCPGTLSYRALRAHSGRKRCTDVCQRRPRALRARGQECHRPNA
jgi:hypothetical protein